MWNCPFQRPAKSLNYMENTSRLQGNRTTSEFLQTKIALMSGYDLSVFWPSSLSVRLSLLNSHTKTKLMFESKQPSRTTSFTVDEREGGKKHRNLIIVWSQAYLSFLLFSRMEMTSWWPNRVDLNWGPFGEPFHHLNSTSSNSHDLMHCRMPEICCLCFLFSPSTLSHQQKKG